MLLDRFITSFVTILSVGLLAGVNTTPPDASASTPITNTATIPNAAPKATAPIPNVVAPAPPKSEPAAKLVEQPAAVVVPDELIDVDSPHVEQPKVAVAPVCDCIKTKGRCDCVAQAKAVSEEYCAPCAAHAAKKRGACATGNCGQVARGFRGNVSERRESRGGRRGLFGGRLRGMCRRGRCG